MNLLSPRAKSSQYLTLLLSAMLAFPSNLPTLEREDGRPDVESYHPAPGRSRPCVHRPDRKPARHYQDWSVDADEAEVPVVLDHFRYAPPALPHRPLDLPSLVPATFDPLPLGPVVAVAPSIFMPPLRC